MYIINVITHVFVIDIVDLLLLCYGALCTCPLIVSIEKSIEHFRVEKVNGNTYEKWPIPTSPRYIVRWPSYIGTTNIWWILWNFRSISFLLSVCFSLSVSTYVWFTVRQLNGLKYIAKQCDMCQIEKVHIQDLVFDSSAKDAHTHTHIHRQNKFKAMWANIWQLNGFLHHVTVAGYISSLKLAFPVYFPPSPQIKRQCDFIGFYLPPKNRHNVYKNRNLLISLE